MKPLPPGYLIREMPEEEIAPLWKEHSQQIFGAEFFHVRRHDLISEAEQAQVRELTQRLSNRYRLNLGVFHHGEFVGWMRGIQNSNSEFEMVNSAIFTEHRRRGLYSALLQETFRLTRAAGFQALFSAHNATNNAVIIPKLQAGFMITGWQIVDVFGTLVRLHYFMNEDRRELMRVRTGQSRPNARMRDLLDL